MIAAVALVAAAADARAQASGISLQAPKASKIVVATDEVATMAFTVRNEGKDTTVAQPTVVAPAGWRVVMSPAATVVAPGERDIWLVSVKAPANAAAGSYAVRLEAERQSMSRVTIAGPVASDSVIVSISERHEVAVRAIGSLSYVMGGEAYTGTFIVQNLGNVAARFDLSAKSTQGNAPSLVSQVIALAPGQLDTVEAKVMIPSSVTTTAEEVLLLQATDVAVDSVRAEASMQATVVPSVKGAPRMWTVPTELALRTATAGSGVSMFTASGYGQLAQGSDVMVDFMIHGPTGQTSSMFGEQETYRLGLRNKTSSLRLGDDSYGFSRLLTSGARGTGAEVRTEMHGFTGGAYVQRDRGRPDAPTEMSAMVATDDKRAVAGTLVALNRSSSAGSAQAVTVGTNALVGGTTVGVELAASDSQNMRGGAGRVRVAGASRYFAYDFGAQRTGTRFASSQQGSTDVRAAIIGNRVGSVFITGNSNLHMSDPLAVVGGFGQRLSTTSLAASWTNGTTLEIEHFDRADVGGFSPIVGRMETMRARSRHGFGMFDASMSFQGGVASHADSAARFSLGLGGALSANLDEKGSVSVFADYANGKGLGESGSGTLTAGVNSQLHLNATTLRAMSFLSQSSANGHMTTQTDLTVEQALSRSTIALRARLAAMARGPMTHAVFLEIKTPLGLPTAPMNTIGRARAEVIDAETGRGVAGALVRVGGQAAVTDAQGVAMFRDLKPGEYSALVDGAAVAGRVVASGGTVKISPTSRKPAAFSMRLSRGSQILVRVRSFERTSAMVANGGDTLTEVGALGQVMVALVTPTDTLWQTSDERGRVDFGSVAPGRYTVVIPRYDAPANTAFAQTEFAIDVTAGEQRQVDFKLIPKIRAIEFQGEAVLIAVPAGATKAAPVPTAITGKPDPAPITIKPEQPITARPTNPARNQRQNPEQPKRNNNNQDPR